MKRSPVFVLVVVLVLASLATPGAQAAAAPAPLTPRTNGKCSALPQETFYVPTRGGDVFVRLLRPKCPDALRATVPVILTYTPYAVLGVNTTDMLNFVHRGYARAIADLVGTGNSGGCWDYGGAREQESAYDLVEYLGAQSWSNGKVAMMGASYDGTTANMAAVAHPPHLATIVPQVAISDWYGYAYGDGVRYFIMDPAQRQGLVIDEQGFDTPESFDTQEGALPPADMKGPQTGDTNYAQHLIERECAGMTDKVVHTARGYSPDPDYDAFWRARGYINDAASVQIPVLVEGGWRDYNVKHSESVRWFNALTNASYKMLVMGQDAHGLPSDTADLDKLHHAWFDTFLYGFDGHDADHPDTFIAQQPQSVSKSSDGTVNVDATWPPPSASGVTFVMNRGRLFLAGDLCACVGETDVLTDSGTETESRALNTGLPGTTDPDRVWFITAPLKTDLRISGMPSLDLGVTTLGTSTHFTPVLFDVGGNTAATPATGNSLCSFIPQQNACVMSRGFLNARYRNSLEHGEDLTPGAPYRATVRFIDNDWVVKAGHQIAIAIMSSNAWWAMQDPQRAVNMIDISDSSLSLPVVDGETAAEQAGI